MTPDSSPLDDFWESSSITTASVRAFASRMQAFTPADVTIHPFVGPGAPIPLRGVNDRTQRFLSARRSTRSFGTKPLRHRDLERLLAAVGSAGDGRRTIPEAGGLDVVFTYAVARRVDGPFDGRILRYDHRSHAAADVGPAPSDAALRSAILFDEGADLPQLLLLFVIDPGPVRAKYGDRAGRFVLQQVGHATQNVGLRLAADGLVGYELGGGLDHEVLALLGLTATSARFGAAIACGR